MSNKPLLLAYAVYQDDGEIHVYFETVCRQKNISDHSTADKNIAELTVEQLMSKIYLRFEQIITQYPSQWYWSYKRWKK